MSGFGLSLALEALTVLALIVIGVLIIALVVKLLILLPTALVALVAWLLTKDKLLTAIAFLAVAVVSLLKRL